MTSDDKDDRKIWWQADLRDNYIHRLVGRPNGDGSIMVRNTETGEDVFVYKSTVVTEIFPTWREANNWLVASLDDQITRINQDLQTKIMRRNEASARTKPDYTTAKCCFALDLDCGIETIYDMWDLEGTEE